MRRSLRALEDWGQWEPSWSTNKTNKSSVNSSTSLVEPRGSSRADDQVYHPRVGQPRSQRPANQETPYWKRNGSNCSWEDQLLLFLFLFTDRPAKRHDLQIYMKPPFLNAPLCIWSSNVAPPTSVSEPECSAQIPQERSGWLADSSEESNTEKQNPQDTIFRIQCAQIKPTYKELHSGKYLSLYKKAEAEWKWDKTWTR